MPNFTKPTFFKATVKSTDKTNGKYSKLDLVSLKKDINFIPGQFVNLKVSANNFRAYSICSDNKILPEFSLVIETGHEGLGSNYIKSLKPGELITLIGPSGKFTLPDKLMNSLYFFATGSGITPFISIFYKLLDDKFAGKVRLFFGIRYESDIIFNKELNIFKSKMRNFSYNISISQPRNKSLKPQRISGYVNKLKNKKSLYFICGNPSMISEVESGLLRNSIPGENILKERFTLPAQTGKV